MNIEWHPGKTMAEIKCEALRLALIHFGGNRTRAAESLGVSQRSVRLWIGMDPESYPPPPTQEFKRPRNSLVGVAGVHKSCRECGNSLFDHRGDDVCQRCARAWRRLKSG